jgi:aminopeptidase-like protein
MSKRNAYPTLSIKGGYSKNLRQRMDVLSLCDGHTSLLEIANRIAIPIWELEDSISELLSMGLIKKTGSLLIRWRVFRRKLDRNF